MYYIVFYVDLEDRLGRTKTARTIYIDNEQIEALKRLSQRTKVPQSVYVREALDMLLEKYSEQLKFDFKASYRVQSESSLAEGEE